MKKVSFQRHVSSCAGAKSRHLNHENALVEDLSTLLG